MHHLTPEELLDLAEGARPGEMFPHLDSCDACRRELSELQATLASAAAVAVPEPSPLFWDHLSARVREAVEAENRVEVRPALLSWPTWRFALPFGVAAVLVVTLMVGLRMRVSEPGTAATPSDSAVLVDGTAMPDVGPGAPDDSSLDLMADLTGEWDWDFATEAGLAARAGAVESLVEELSDDERLELRRLLEEELSSRSGV